MNFIDKYICRFTFLITLFLLLFVSTAIAFRTYIMRRRFRREAPPGDPVIPFFPRSTEETIVPVIYDVYFTPGTSWHNVQVCDQFLPTGLANRFIRGSARVRTTT